MRPARFTAVCIAVLSAVIALGACRADRTTSASESGGRVEVVASFYPLFEVASRVGGDRVAVTNLVAAGAEPHDTELSPEQVERLDDADLAIALGEGFQPDVEKAAKRRKAPTLLVLDAAQKEDDAHADGADAGGDDGHGHDDDPHVWLDPAQLRRIVDDVAGALAEVDGRNAAVYEKNAAAYGAELEQLDQRMEAGLSGCARRLIVTSHDAFGHLARAYGLEQEPVAGLSPDDEPDPKRLDELVRRIKATGATTVFTETLAAPEIAETLAREADVDTAVLNPIEGLTSEDAEAGETYVTLMDKNLAALRAALGCP